VSDQFVTTVDKKISTGRRGHWTGASMVLAGAILWGVSGTAAQVLFQRFHFHPAWLVSIRMTVAGVLLLAVSAIRFGPKPVLTVWSVPRDAVGLILFGTIGLLLVQYSYLVSIATGNAATATLLQYLGPVFITAYLAVRQRQAPNRWELTAVILALLGTFLLVTDGQWKALSVSSACVVWGLISAVSLAFYTLYPKKLLGKYPPSTVVGWGMLIGGFTMSMKYWPWAFTGASSVSSWLLTVFVVLFGTLLAFYLYLTSLRYLTPTQTSILACAEPLAASVVAIVVLRVPMGVFGILGGMCILSTVVILALQRPRQRAG